MAYRNTSSLFATPSSLNELFFGSRSLWCLLSHGNIGNEGAARIAEVLAEHPHKFALTLSDHYFNDQVRELSEFIGNATNNIAELTAVLRAVELGLELGRPLRLYTDSQYSIGVLT